MNSIFYWFHDINYQVIDSIDHASSTEALPKVKAVVKEANVM